MRVLHVVKTSQGATWAWRQMRELVRLGIKVAAAMPPGGPMVKRYEEIGVEVHHLDPAPSLRSARATRRSIVELRELVEHVSPDLIHLHSPVAAVMTRVALGRHHPLPRLLQVPGPLHMEHTISRQVDVRTAGPRDGWVASCFYTRDLYLLAGVAPSRVGMSYYAADVPELNGAVDSPLTLRADLKVPAKTRIIGMVAYMYAPKRYLGQVRGIKGHEDLIDAVALALRSRDDLLAVFVGGPWDGADVYEARICRYGKRKLGAKAVFLGTREDVTQLYRNFDVVVHPSHSENVGGAFESLLLETPTIATSVGGLPELVRPGETGWLVPSKDPRALCDALLDVLANPAEARERALAGKRLASVLGDVSRSGREMLQYYERILGTPAGRQVVVEGKS
jgi:glycosyltransferase involved in cell wall biosynthesis